MLWSSGLEAARCLHGTALRQTPAQGGHLEPRPAHGHMRRELTTCEKEAVSGGGDRLRHDVVRWTVCHQSRPRAESRRAEPRLGAPGSDSDSALPCMSVGIDTSLSEFPPL